MINKYFYYGLAILISIGILIIGIISLINGSKIKNPDENIILDWVCKDKINNANNQCISKINNAVIEANKKCKSCPTVTSCPISTCPSCPLSTPCPIIFECEPEIGTIANNAEDDGSILFTITGKCLLGYYSSSLVDQKEILDNIKNYDIKILYDYTIGTDIEDYSKIKGTNIITKIKSINNSIMLLQTYSDVPQSTNSFLIVVKYKDKYLNVVMNERVWGSTQDNN